MNVKIIPAEEAPERQRLARERWVEEVGRSRLHEATKDALLSPGILKAWWPSAE